MDRDRLKIFCGTANPALAEEICACLGVPLAQSVVSRFSDGEVRLQILENVRGITERLKWGSSSFVELRQ